MPTLVFLAVLFIAGFAFKAYMRKRRLAALAAKHGDPDVALRILKRMFWAGQTAEQLRDALGRPVEVDQRLLKTKKREIWKYKKTGKNRFALRITLDNDLVTEWDQKAS